jgi:hypothetical protein
MEVKAAIVTTIANGSNTNGLTTILDTIGGVKLVK